MERGGGGRGRGGGAFGHSALCGLAEYIIRTYVRETDLLLPSVSLATFSLTYTTHTYTNLNPSAHSLLVLTSWSINISIEWGTIKGTLVPIWVP